MKKFVATLALLACSGITMAASPDTPPSINVTGTGKVLYVPDIGYIHVGVAGDGWTAAEAWKKNEQIVKKIFAELKKLGVQEKDLKTDNLSVQPRYQEVPKKAPKFVGYTVTYDLAVTVRDLKQMGAYLDAMVDAGANRNMNISFGCSKLDALMDQARVKAVEEARRKASLYVTGAGARLGDVLAISDNPYAAQPRYYPVDALALREAKASIPVAAGEQELSITVSVTWAIDNTHLEPAA